MGIILAKSQFWLFYFSMQFSIFFGLSISIFLALQKHNIKSLLKCLERTDERLRKRAP